MLMNTTFLGDSFFIKWQSRAVQLAGLPLLFEQIYKFGQHILKNVL